MRRDFIRRYLGLLPKSSFPETSSRTLSDTSSKTATSRLSARQTSRNRCSWDKLYLVICFPWVLAGCTRAPSFDIVGSFFPAWLVCLMLGILATAISHLLLLRVKVALALPILVYPSLAALLTFLLWLVFFS